MKIASSVLIAFFLTSSLIAQPSSLEVLTKVVETETMLRIDHHRGQGTSAFESFRKKRTSIAAEAMPGMKGAWVMEKVCRRAWLKILPLVENGEPSRDLIKQKTKKVTKEVLGQYPEAMASLGLAYANSSIFEGSVALP